MPKKTKREKMAADLRRKTIPSLAQSSSTLTHKGTSPASQSFQYTFTAPKKREVIASPIDESQLAAIKRDIAKTLILATVAVSAEIFLWAKAIVR